MIPLKYVKPTLVVLSSSSAGFYVGGRYVGGLASAGTSADGPPGMFGPPEWVMQAQETLWLVLGLCVVTALLWVVADWTEHNQ